MRMLTEAAQADREAFECHAKETGCACHINPPCSYCTHPGNPLNQEEDESCWTFYTKDEALWYAVCQMRRAARTFEIVDTQLDREHMGLTDIYAKGLDMCADECEKVMNPEELKRLKKETFSTYCPICGRSGAGREANETGGVDICYDPWHEGVEA